MSDKTASRWSPHSFGTRSHRHRGLDQRRRGRSPHDERASRRGARRPRHLSTAHALELIERIVREAECPVIAVLEGHDASFVDEAAKRGVFAYIVDGDGGRIAERARHHAAPLRRVPQPAGRVRPPRADGARQGHSHGALPGGRAPSLRDAARSARHSGQKLVAHRTGRARRAPAPALRPPVPGPTTRP